MVAGHKHQAIDDFVTAHFLKSQWRPTAQALGQRRKGARWLKGKSRPRCTSSIA